MKDNAGSRAALPDAHASRPGEATFAPPEPAFDDAGLVFIGHVVSPYAPGTPCPKNRRQALTDGRGGALHLAERYRPALEGLAARDAIFVLTFLDRARRDLAVQAPRHTERPRGTFGLRSPVRPNPIGLHLCVIIGLDKEAGRIDVDAIDALDATPLLDVKPYLAGVDRPDMPVVDETEPGKSRTP